MTESRQYDLVVLGGGAAAFAAITEADRRGLSTAVVNAGLPLGGTCVNVGCIPSKRLLAVADAAAQSDENTFDAVEYSEGEPAVDWATALDGTDDLVGRLRRENYVDVADRFGTDVYEGYGRGADGPRVDIGDGPNAGARIAGETVLIATGSAPRIAPIDGIETVDYETSESILERRDLPASIAIIGGGSVALEWGQILHRVGVDVTILQRSGHVLSGMDGRLGRELQRAVREDGIAVLTGVDFDRVGSVRGRDSGGTPGGVVVDATVDGDSHRVGADALFVATGVRPNTDGIGLADVGIETDERGAVVVDDRYRTANADVYAAGDVVGAPELETVAAKEGNRAVRNAFGSEVATIDYAAVPKVVFTSPEVATVGTTEREYMEEHGTCTCQTIDVSELPKAKATQDTRGLVQVVKHHETDEIVGVHMISPRAADMIPEATLAVKFGRTVDDIVDTIHPFPTFSEAFKRACQAFRRDTSTMSCCVE